MESEQTEREDTNKYDIAKKFSFLFYLQKKSNSHTTLIKTCQSMYAKSEYAGQETYTWHYRQTKGEDMFGRNSDFKVNNGSALSFGICCTCLSLRHLPKQNHVPTGFLCTSAWGNICRCVNRHRIHLQCESSAEDSRPLKEVLKTWT